MEMTRVANVKHTLHVTAKEENAAENTRAKGKEKMCRARARNQRQNKAGNKSNLRAI